MASKLFGLILKLRGGWMKRKTLLMTLPFGRQDDNELPARYDLASFLTSTGKYEVVLDRRGNPERWLDYDVVFWCLDRELDFADTRLDYEASCLAQLKRSMQAGQPRLAVHEDPYFKPLSLLKQVELADDSEYTHKLVLNASMQQRSDFSRYKAIESSSIDKAAELVCPMWACPADDLSSYHTDFSKPMAKVAMYAGYPKPDRKELLAKYSSIVYERLSYSDYLSRASRCLAGVMMNSPEHKGQASARFYESAALSAQLWPADISVLGFQPELTFSTNDELLDLLAMLSKQTSAQRQAMIAKQKAKALACLAEHRVQFLDTVDWSLWP